MTRATRHILVGGCALVLLFELPTTVRAFFSGLRGPYASETGVARARVDLGSAEGARLAGLLLLVRP